MMRGVANWGMIGWDSYVRPDGPVPCKYAMVGEAPVNEEIRVGRGFVGPSGKLIWPLMRRLANLSREEVYVSNLCKLPLDIDLPSDEKMDEEDFRICAAALQAELRQVKPEVVLAVGVLAARGLLGDDFTKMEVCNGVGFKHSDGYVVVPTWHPAAALRGGGEDALAYTGAAVASLRQPKMPRPLVIPAADYRVEVGSEKLIGIDTEGTTRDPICLTWATGGSRSYVKPKDVPQFWMSLRASGATAIYHNAPWDWAVIEKMGVTKPWLVPYRDTMELAYLRQVEPRGLKGLAYRHYRLRMKTWEEVTLPYYFQAVQLDAKAIVDAGITSTPRYGKKGQLLKKPAITITDEAKTLKRALENPKLLATRMGWWDGEMGGSNPPTLRFVPQEEVVEYATLDPYMTLKVLEVLG